MLQDVIVDRRVAFLMWSHFADTMIHCFELVTEVEEAQKQLEALRQTSQVGGCIQKFHEL